MGNDGAETDWYSSTRYATPPWRFERWLVLGISDSHIRFLKLLFLYPCTLKVLPLAVFRSFSSFSGLARLSTGQVRSSLRNIRQGQYIPCRKSAVRLRILEWMYALRLARSALSALFVKARIGPRTHLGRFDVVVEVVSKSLDM